ncbi:MAG: RNA polymerase sigma factor [Thermoguttaceae bacterium]
MFPQTSTTLEQQDLTRLVAAAQDGDREAFEQLFRQFQRVVYLTAYRRLGNEAEAQELCQDVFVQALRKLDQLHDPACFGGWIRSITTRMAINRAVRSRTMASLDVEGALPAGDDGAETPLAQVLAREEREQLHVGLNRLSDMDRSTLTAFYFRGRSLVQMSDEFHSPVGTIKRRLHVARKRLAEELETLSAT